MILSLPGTANIKRKGGRISFSIQVRANFPKPADLLRTLFLKNHGKNGRIPGCFAGPAGILPYFASVTNARKPWQHTKFTNETTMEQINKIEIIGLVGNVRTNIVGGTLVVNFSVATSYAYKGRDGNPVIDTQWFMCSAWEGKGMPDLTRISKGSPIRVFGRIRTRNYTTSEGVDKQEIEVKASRVELLDPEIMLTPSM